MTAVCKKSKEKIDIWVAVTAIILLFIALKFFSCEPRSTGMSLRKAAHPSPWAAGKQAPQMRENNILFFAIADREAVHAVPPSAFLATESTE
ncbi:MAG: hypothetical protein WCZ89_06815, partial [Phycisphaerae bacterium]